MTVSDPDIFAYDDSRDRVAPQSGAAPLLLGYAAYSNQLRYPSMLSSIWRGDKLYNPSYALATDPDAYEVCMRYAPFRQAVDARLRKVSSRKFAIIPGDDDDASKRLAEICEAWFERISRFVEVKYELARAAILGESYAYLCGKRKLTSLSNHIGRWWCVDRVDDIDPRRMFLKIQQGPDGRRHARLAMWRIGRDDDNPNRPDLLPSTTGDNWIELPKVLPLVRSIYNDEESRLGRGRGVLEAGYQEVWIAQETRQLANEGVAAAARGMILAKIDTLAQGSKTSAQRKSEWLDFLDEVQRNNRGVYDKRDEIEFHTGWDSGVDHALAIINHCNDNIRGLILGSSSPFGGGGEGGGSLAKSREEGDQSDEIIDYDCAKLDDDITRDFIGAFMRYNRTPIRAHGLEAARPPKFESTRAKKFDPPERVETATKFLALGEQATIRLDELREQLGFSEPNDGDVVLKGQQPPQPGMGAGAGAGQPGGDGAAGANPLAELLGGGDSGDGGDSGSGKGSRGDQGIGAEARP